MANPVKTLAGEKLLIQVGNGATPEVFSHPCMINAERGISISSEVTDVSVIDCDDPSKPGWKEIFKDGMSMEVTGGGNFNTPEFLDWFNWASDDLAKNVRIKIDVPGALGGGYMSLPMKLVTFGLSGPRKNNSNVDIHLQSHGKPTWTPNP